MSDYTFKHGVEGSLPNVGEWVRADMDYPERAADLARHGVKAFCCCPNGHVGSLITHTIDENGEVRPSYHCIRQAEVCGFHVFARLEGWSEWS